MPMHFLGGLWVGFVYLYFFSRDNNSLDIILKIMLFVLLIGLGWEFYEILFVNILAQNPFNTLDTISDIFFDLSGGLCAILYLWRT